MEQKILHILCVAISVEGILEEKNITLAIELICEYGFDKEKFIKAIEALREESF